MSYIYWFTLKLLSNFFRFAKFFCVYSDSLMVRLVLGRKQKLFLFTGVQAMTCINEILSKKFVPAEYETFLFLMFQQTFNLLQAITKGQSRQNALIKQLDERYFFNVKFYKMFPDRGGFCQNPRILISVFLNDIFGVTIKRLTWFHTASENQENWILELRYIGESYWICSF